MMPEAKTIVCVFAHPDDEAFGPGGTIAKLTKKNSVYIICVTNGDAGQSTIVSREHLGDVREKELARSARILGVKKVFFLGFRDGSLSNNLYHVIAEKIERKVRRLDTNILITFEPRGVSGHIDHIVVSLVTTFVFEKLSGISMLWYYCSSDRLRSLVKNYFIYFPPGYKQTEIDMTVNISSVWDTKVRAMQQHTSQNDDIEKTLGWQSRVPKEEYFLVLKNPFYL